MMKDSLENARAHWSNGFEKSKSHCLFSIQSDCQKQLSTTADIPNIPDVYLNISNDLLKCLINHPAEFRKYEYSIVDECNFTKIKCHE